MREEEVQAEEEVLAPDHLDVVVPALVHPPRVEPAPTAVRAVGDVCFLRGF